MTISFKKALTLPFKDENWINKTGVCALMLIPGLISSISLGAGHPLSFLAYFIMASLIGGYAVISAHNEINDIQPTMPDWDFAAAAITTLKGWVISLAYSLILLPIIFILLGIAMVDRSYIAISIVLAVPVLIFYGFLTNIGASLFYENLEIGSAFYFKKILQILKVGYLDYIVATLLSVAIGFIYGFAAGILMALTKTINANIGVYAQNVANVLIVICCVNLIAQAYKEARAKL